MLGLQWMKVTLSPHDDSWHEEFERTERHIRSIWGDAVLDVQHVGSTAVKNICAKPILDVAVVVKSFSEMDVPAFEAAGYRYMGARTAEADRHLFARHSAADDALVTHHIHIYEPGNADFMNLIGFRDYLNSHPAAAKEYNDIKMNAANANPDDRFAYSDKKRAFIERVITIINGENNEKRT